MRDAARVLGAGSAQRAGKLQQLRPWLPSVCHMAIADASARLAGHSAPAPDSDGDGEQECSPTAASDVLLVALNSLPRLTASEVGQDFNFVIAQELKCLTPSGRLTLGVLSVLPWTGAVPGG